MQRKKQVCRKLQKDRIWFHALEYSKRDIQDIIGNMGLRVGKEVENEGKIGIMRVLVF